MTEKAIIVCVTVDAEETVTCSPGACCPVDPWANHNTQTTGN